jgi:beta-N-acetylhexosaminidase
LLDEDDFAYLIDFGIARAADQTRMTGTGGVIGSWPYMSPERLRDGQVDPRADIYALACVLYECLTGSTPYPGDSFEQQMTAHLMEPPPRPSSTDPNMPVALDPVIATGMAKDRDQRYATTIELADAARDAITEPSARTTRRPPPLPATEQAPHSPTEREGNRVTAQPRTMKAASLGSAKPAPPQTIPPTPTKAGGTTRRTTIALIAGAIAFVAAIAAAVAIPALVKHRPPGSSPASKPVAAPAPPVCGDPTTMPTVLSTRDKLAQLLMVGVKNADDARAVVNDDHVGGIFIGSWTDLSIFQGPLADIAGKAGPLPLAVSVDEEGGRVARLKSLIGTAPSPRALAQTQTVQQVHDLALERGKKMHDLGITVDFAPVVDVSDEPDDSVIGDRSFSNDPATVTAYAGAYAQGLRDAGLLPVLKHFPGHGHGSGDSHKGGVVTPPLSQLQTSDLVPYRTLVTQAPVAVMIGHLQVPGLTGDDPASLSRAAVQLLREGTGYGAPPFNGPVFSDDLSSMAAISDRYGVSEAVLRTLQAGTDVALWVTTNEVPAVLDRLEKAVAANELTMPAVDQSLVRVATMKGSNRACGH